MGPIGCPETSVRNDHHSLRNNPEERSSQENKPSGMASATCTEGEIKVVQIIDGMWTNIF